MSIRTRLFLGFSVLGLLIPLGVVLSLGQCRISLQNAIGNDFALLAQQTLDKIDREVNLRLEEARFHGLHLSQLCGTIRSIDQVPEKALTQYCRQIYRSTPHASDRPSSIFTRVDILDPNQSVLVQIGSPFAELPVTLPDRWLTDSNQPDVLVDDRHPSQAITLLVRLASQQNPALGLLRLDINPQEFFDILADIPLESTYHSTQVHLLTRDNAPLFSTHPQDLGALIRRSHLGLIRPKTWKLCPAEPQLSLPSQLIAQAISRGFHNYNGLGWRLLIVHDTQEVLQPVRTMSHTLLIPALGVTLLAWAFALLIASSISRPIRELEQTARAIRDGDLNRHINIQRRDEIGSLATCFEAMTQQLRQTIGTLQHEISERRITDQHLAEVNRDLAVTINQLQSAHKEVNDFAYAAAHDLKTPIRGMITLVQWIISDFSDEAENTSPELLDHIQLLHSRAQRCASLVDGILDYCRAGHGSGKICQLNCEVLISRLLEEIEPPDHVQIHIQENLPIISADPISLEQVLRPLLLNAFEYCNPQEGHIHIRFKDNHDHWTFSIQDNGPGIASEYHKRIFSMFQTLALRDDTEHAGIGLTIAQKTVHAWGGDLWLESQPGHGATFFFTWPKHPYHPPRQLAEPLENAL